MTGLTNHCTTPVLGRLELSLASCRILSLQVSCVSFQSLYVNAREAV